MAIATSDAAAAARHARDRAAVRGRRLQFAAVALAAYALAFIQRPGETVVDTRLELSADPSVFLDRVWHIWSATTDFGHVQGGQFNGYLFPMAPWFAFGDALGLPMWVTQRLWLGSLLLIAAWGAVRLMDALLERRSVVASSSAALVFAVNPYVVLFTSRGTVTLLAHAALPWLMLIVHRGLREPRRWTMPAAIGLILAATGGGVNAAVIAFALLGPISLAAYEVLTRHIPARAAVQFGWRAALTAAIGSAWWAIPVLLQGRYGVDILIYTEQPDVIWRTTSFPELLRMLGFWGLYTGVGFGGREPFMGVGATYLFNPVVVVASFCVPLFAAATFPLVRRWRYAPYFGLLVFGALVVMFAGFPRESRLHQLLLDVYSGFPAIQFLRTTYKGMPLLVLALACLVGAGAGALVDRARAGRLRVAGRRVPAVALAVLALAPLVAALPLLEGRAIDREQAYGSVPSWWTKGTADASAAGGRTMVVPGEMFGWYRWGGTMDPVGPPLRHEPVAIRELVPYADSRSAFLQIAIDDLVQQDRLVPNQLGPLLKLTGVHQLLVARDGRLRRDGAVAPVAAQAALSEQDGLAPERDYGPRRLQAAIPGRGYPPERLAEISRRAAPGDALGVRLAAGPPAILEGDAEGVTELAADGLLNGRRPLVLAGDVDRAELGRLTAAGAPILLTDSARRRIFISPRTQGNRGPTLTATTPIDADAATFNPFPERGSAGQTVAVYSGLRRLSSPTAPGWENFPQYRAFAALDGRLDTSWRADGNVPAKRWYMELELARPRRVGAIDVVPQSDRRGHTDAFDVSVNGGPVRRVQVHPGPNRIDVGDTTLRTLRLRVADIGGNKDTRGAGGITELRVPGLHVREHLRLPTALSSAARGLDVSRSPIDIALARTTSDFPYRSGADSLDPESDHPLARLDAEDGLERSFDLPDARRFAISGWGSIAPNAPDDALDRLAGLRGGWRLRSSSRFEGVPGRRASSAFDGDPATAWAGNVVPGDPAWIEWTAPASQRVSELRLRPGPAGYRFPTRVRLSGAGVAPIEAEVAADGSVVLPRALDTRRLRLEVLDSEPRGNGGLRDVRAVALGEVEIPGVSFPAVPRDGRFSTGCDELAVRAAGHVAGAALAGTVRELDEGRALRLRGCRDLSLPAGRVRLSAPPGGLARPDHLLLSAPAPEPVSAAATPPGRVVSSKRGGAPGAVESARLALDRAGWIVLEQSYSPGWKATCHERGGGEHDLGESTPVDGYANGWRVTPDCQEVSFDFAPQRIAVAGYAFSAIGCLVLAAVLLVGWRRRRRSAAPEPAREAQAARIPDEPVRLGPVRALLLAGAIGVVGGGLFSLRVGAVLFLTWAALLLVGVTVKRLASLGAAAIVGVVILYFVYWPEDQGGYNFEYVPNLTRPHYLAVLSVCFLAGAALLAARQIRSVTHRPEG